MLEVRRRFRESGRDIALTSQFPVFAFEHSTTLQQIHNFHFAHRYSILKAKLILLDKVLGSSTITVPANMDGDTRLLYPAALLQLLPLGLRLGATRDSFEVRTPAVKSVSSHAETAYIGRHYFEGAYRLPLQCSIVNNSPL